jgi:cytochrome oxidase Cu insertion factor (SCO1/SenC/PrrC family)
MWKRTLALLCIAVAGWAKTPRPIADMPIPAPGGKQIQLKQYRGKVVLLTLITTTCAECIQTVGILNRLQKEFGPQGFQAVAVAVNLTAKDDAGPFAERYKAAFPVGYLDKAGTMRIADVGGDQKPFVPIAMFIDRAGVVHFQYFGNDPVMKDEEKSFRAIVGGMLKQ